MKAMLLAAGRGERMKPLTLTTPKPLLTAGRKPLIVYHLERLSAAGISEVVINIAHLGEQIKDALGAGAQWGLKIRYSEEPQPLETAGAIVHALPLLGNEPFILINADIWTDYDLSVLVARALPPYQGHLLLTANPEHNPQGDFCILNNAILNRCVLKNKPPQKIVGQPSYTFSGISKLSPDLITMYVKKMYPKKRSVFPLAEVFHYAIERHLLSAEVINSDWRDIGTPERLQFLDDWLTAGGD